MFPSPSRPGDPVAAMRKRGYGVFAAYRCSQARQGEATFAQQPQHNAKIKTRSYACLSFSRRCAKATAILQQDALLRFRLRSAAVAATPG